MSASRVTSHQSPVTAKAGIRVWQFNVEAPKAPGQTDWGFALKMPVGSRITRVGCVGAQACLFAVVNMMAREEERYFWVASTNADLPSPEELEAKFDEANMELRVTGLEPLGTWLEKGTVAKHLFEITAVPAGPRERQPGEN